MARATFPSVGGNRSFQISASHRVSSGVRAIFAMPDSRSVSKDEVLLVSFTNKHANNGEAQLGTVGALVPGSALVICSSVPQSRVRFGTTGINGCLRPRFGILNEVGICGERNSIN